MVPVKEATAAAVDGKMEPRKDDGPRGGGITVGRAPGRVHDVMRWPELREVQGGNAGEGEGRKGSKH